MTEKYFWNGILQIKWKNHKTKLDFSLLGYYNSTFIVFYRICKEKKQGKRPEFFRQENMIRNSLTFQFLKNPFSVGAVCASSPALAQEITTSAGLEKASCIAELGPGTGALTGAILAKKAPDANFFAVELNLSVLEVFRKNFPSVKVYNESAANLKDIAGRENVEKVDSVISGLPWAAFPPALQDELLSAISSTLAEDGIFSTFTYLYCPLLPAGRQFRKKLSRHFSTVESSSIVWKNLPPAFVYRCKK